MDLYKTGRLISELRKEKGLTQKELGEKIGILSKTVSKWETGHGFPDISIIPKLSVIFGVDISKLIEGELPIGKIEPGNMKRMNFYVCEKCGNIIESLGKTEIVCCGRRILPLKAKSSDEEHLLNIEKIEDDYYITFTHSMNKEHFISFVSYVRYDRVLTLKLYPEQGGEIRFPLMHGGKLYYYCTKHGLFEFKI